MQDPESVPIHLKLTLSIKEASEYSNIGICLLYTSYPMVTLCHNFARHQAAFSFASSCRKASCQSSMPL